MNRGMLGQLRDAEACTAFDMGSDHKAVMVKLMLCVERQRRRWRPPKGTVVWKAVDVKEYHQLLDRQVQDIVNINAIEGSVFTLEERCAQLEKAIVEIADVCKTADKTMSRSKLVIEESTKELMRERRKMGGKAGAPERVAISKQIQRDIQKAMKKSKQSKINRILEEFKGLKHIGGIRNNGKRPRMVSMKNKEGQLQNDRQEIADVFAEFYESLYAARSEGLHTKPWLQEDGIEADTITTNEIRNQLKRMAKKQSCRRARSGGGNAARSKRRTTGNDSRAFQ